MIGRQLRQCLAQKLVAALFCKAISGSSALSATVASMVSSSSASMRRRRAESALKRAIESSQVVTAARPQTRLGGQLLDRLARKLGFGRVDDPARLSFVLHAVELERQRMRPLGAAVNATSPEITYRMPGPTW